MKLCATVLAHHQKPSPKRIGEGTDQTMHPCATARNTSNPSQFECRSRAGFGTKSPRTARWGERTRAPFFDDRFQSDPNSRGEGAALANWFRSVRFVRN